MQKISLVTNEKREWKSGLIIEALAAMKICYLHDFCGRVKKREWKSGLIIEALAAMKNMLFAWLLREGKNMFFIKYFQNIEPRQFQIITR